MGQEGEQMEVIDLSQALNETRREVIEDETAADPYAEADGRKVPGIYRVIMKLSGGIIKTENQAKTVAVLIIILTNLITFYLIFQEQAKDEPLDEIPAAEMAGA